MATKQSDRLNNLANLDDGELAVKPPPRHESSMTAPARMVDYAVAPDADKKERLEGTSRRATQVRKLDPTLVRRSRFANRHEDEFGTKEYVELKADIEATGGNTVPGKVRKQYEGGEGTFELIYGHRRHQACLELGLPFLAEICDADDRTVYEEMSRENLHRKDPTPWDWAHFYALGLRDVYKSQDELCKANRKSKAHVSQALQLAELPIEVVAAFPTPLKLQLSWGAPLHNALKANRATVLKKAAELKGSHRPAGEVFRELVGSRERKARVTELKVQGREVGTLTWKSGVVQVKLKQRVLEAEHLHELRKLLEDYLKGRISA